MADEQLRLVSLRVRGGPLKGRHYDPDEVVTQILVGSDPDCHLVFADQPGVSPIHARVEAGLGESVVHDTHAPGGLWVNENRVQGQHPLGPGDVLWLGPPNDPQSVCVECHFAPWVEVLPSSPVVDAAPEASPLSDGEAVVPLDAAEVLAQAFATPDTAGDERPARREAAPKPAEPAATPAAEPVAASPEDDPFFVGEEQDAGLVAPELQPVVAVAPPRVLDPPAPVVPPPFVPQPVVPQPTVPDLSLSPEALVAETIAEDWAVVEPEPAALAPAPAPVRTGPPAAPAADDFFIAEEAGTGGASPLVAAKPPAPSAAPSSLPRLAETSAPAPPPRVPAALRAAEEQAGAPGPAARPSPQRFVPESHPEEPRRANAGVPVEVPRLEPRRVTPTPRREPSPARRPAAAARTAAGMPSRTPPGRRPPASARPARRASRGGSGWLRPLALGAGATVVLAALAFAASFFAGGGVRLETVEPVRLRVGQRATLAGEGFAPDPSGNTVLFDDREAKVVQASPTRLEVEVPDVVAESGAERRVSLVVRRGRRASSPVEIAVFQGPRLHGISPEAALPGELVLLAGAGWGPGATVRFGGAEAQIQEVDATRIRAIVPEAAGPTGTSAPVVVTVGGVDSNPAPFVVGRLPVVSAVSPASAAPGDLLEVTGRGFHADPLANDVRVGGVPALVASSAADALKVVVPIVGPGDGPRALEVRVPGSGNVGQGLLQVAPALDPVGFHFVAEPFVVAPGRPHAVLATGLGPAFVLAASGGRTAAQRAVDAASRLNGAAQALRTTPGLNLEARDVDSNPSLGLAGRPEALLEVTAEDAAAYEEDWTGLRGRGGPATRARLARWWEAVARDIVLLTVRGERPQFAGALAPEGRVLGQLFEAAQRSGRPGVPREVVDEARPAVREGLRLLALRVPAAVSAPALATAAATPALPLAAATPRPGPLALEGTWTGSESEAGRQQYLTVRFRRSGGTIAYEGGITLTLPLLAFEQVGRDQARFSVQIRGGVRHYAGRWDGETLSGPVSTDAAGKNVVARFELRKR